MKGKAASGKGMGKRASKEQKKNGRLTEADFIKELEQRIMDEAPPPGTNPLAADLGSENGKAACPKEFGQLPISAKTKDGLAKAGYVSMKDIQRAAIGHILAGRDVLGAAKTGSGKTLAFLIPTIEKLYRLRWTQMDGLGALVISPTRELAIQIFQVLRKIGPKHDISGGLVIGGKDLEEEQERINGMNILVATPGRILQVRNPQPSTLNPQPLNPSTRTLNPQPSTLKPKLRILNHLICGTNIYI
jgi:ATP-dependent RNA helicase DDX10/DBP4